MTDKYWTYSLGIKEKEGTQVGVALVVKDDKNRCIRNEKLINEILLSVNISEEEGNEKFTLIVAYGSNEDGKREDKETFFDGFQTLTDQTKNKVIIMGVINGRVGDRSEGIKWYLGKYGEKRGT